jgi:hypothetical protein
MNILIKRVVLRDITILNPLERIYFFSFGLLDIETRILTCLYMMIHKKPLWL